uniref:Uncharacterized protein n=1 Tax=Hordeum vulgare subsp. vulgare TaxID=112509 RepID=A0A8I6XXQ8_HORVV
MQYGQSRMTEYLALHNTVVACSAETPVSKQEKIKSHQYVNVVQHYKLDHIVLVQWLDIDILINKTHKVVKEHAATKFQVAATLTELFYI